MFLYYSARAHNRVGPCYALLHNVIDYQLNTEQCVMCKAWICAKHNNRRTMYTEARLTQVILDRQCYEGCPDLHTSQYMVTCVVGLHYGTGIVLKSESATQAGRLLVLHVLAIFTRGWIALCGRAFSDLCFTQ